MSTSNWSFTDTSSWGGLCNAGVSQSPINIDTELTIQCESLCELKMNYKLNFIILFCLFLFSCDESSFNKTKTDIIDFENRYKNIGFALIYNDNLEDIKKLFYEI